MDFCFTVFEAKSKNLHSALTRPNVGRTRIFYKLMCTLEFNIYSSKSKRDGPDSYYPAITATLSLRASSLILSCRVTRILNGGRSSNKKFSGQWKGGGCAKESIADCARGLPTGPGAVFAHILTKW